MADYNAELVAYELRELNVKVETIRVNTEASRDRLHEAEKQSALQEQSLQTLCKKVESLDEDVKDLDSDIERSNLVSKVIGGIAGGLAVVAAAIGISK
jgi:chromosome segregation ATPase